MAGVHLDVLLLGMLAAALRGDVGDGAFEHFQERLLDAFAGDVAGDGDVAGGFADLVDLVDVDDAALRGFQIVVGVLKKLQEDVFDVFTDVAGFGERGGVADREGDVEDAGEGFGEERFAAAGGADEQDVALVDFDIIRCRSSDRRCLGACSDCGRRRRGLFSRSPGR